MAVARTQRQAMLLTVAEMSGLWHENVILSDSHIQFWTLWHKAPGPLKYFAREALQIQIRHERYVGMVSIPVALFPTFEDELDDSTLQLNYTKRSRLQ